MSGSYLSNPIAFLIEVLFGLYITIVVLRFLFQWVRADFYNPISQFVIKVTTPVLNPLRGFVPGYGGVDLAALVLAWLLTSLKLGLLALLKGLNVNPLGVLLWAIPDLVDLIINIFLFAVFIRVILSWVNPDPYHPGVALLEKLTDPLMRRAQRILPPISGLDLSPILVVVGLMLLKMLLLPPLLAMTGSPF